jgi:hypothetical protein
MKNDEREDVPTIQVFGDFVGTVTVAMTVDELFQLQCEINQAFADGLLKADEALPLLHVAGDGGRGKLRLDLEKAQI